MWGWGGLTGAPAQKPLSRPSDGCPREGDEILQFAEGGHHRLYEPGIQMAGGVVQVDALQRIAQGAAAVECGALLQDLPHHLNAPGGVQQLGQRPGEALEGLEAFRVALQMQGRSGRQVARQLCLTPQLLDVEGDLQHPPMQVAKGLVARGRCLRRQLARADMCQLI